MGRSLRLRDRESVEDVGTYLSRARAVDAEGAVRFQAVGGAVGIWTCALAKQGLLDSTPTVLGLRTAGLGRFVFSTQTSRNNIGSKHKGRLHKVAAWFGNDAQSTRLAFHMRTTRRKRLVGEVLRKSTAQHSSNCFKVEVLKSPANIQQIKNEAVLAAHVKGLARTENRVTEGLRVVAARADVEAHTHHVQLQLTRLGKQTWHFLQRRTKLDTELTYTLRVVRQNAKHKLAVGVKALHLDKLVNVVKRR